ncbi:MAG: CatA-like O-acetyltransferase [Vulcanimicrobiota bacterium]
MNEKRRIDLEKWERKEHFMLFMTFDEPFFGICTNIECTKTYQMAKEQNISFFLLYLYRSLEAANDIEVFRYRTEDDGVVCYDCVHASTVVNRDNGTVGFSYITFYRDLPTFLKEAAQAVEIARNETGLRPAIRNENVIHYTTIPWIQFTSFSHARRFGKLDSIPKIAFGKMYGEGEKLMMPISIHVHHALMDGRHVAEYLERFQQLLNL